MRRLPFLPTAALLAAGLISVAPAARAQVACRTTNCADAAAPPAACQQRAVPRRLAITVASFSFTPNAPKIEPGDCILWDASGGVHSSAADSCPDDGASSCANPPPPSCKWDTGNISAPPSPSVDAVCSYDAAAFPGNTSWGFYCRQHDNPSHTGFPGMAGTLRVTPAIVLSVGRSGATANLSWTGGDGQFKVEIAANDRTFQTGRTTLNPAGGASGTTYADAVAPPPGTARFYLVRNRQTNEA
jgi:plastocyanin